MILLILHHGYSLHGQTHENFTKCAHSTQCVLMFTVYLDWTVHGHVHNARYSKDVKIPQVACC